MIIENNVLRIDINLNGGALTSVFDKRSNDELLYQKDERSWMGQDVVIFPVVARLKDGSYLYDNKEYFMKNHGLIRYNNLDVIYHDLTKIVLGFKYNEETLIQYPFKFNFEISYELIDNVLKIEYHVYNVDDKVMYFNVGGHPALKVNGYETDTEYIFEDVTLVFDQEYKVKKYELNDKGTFITLGIDTLLPKCFKMSKELINKEKTLIYDVSNINKVTLKSKNKEFVFDISDAPFLAIWSNPGFGDFLCVEPWWGLPDFDDSNKILNEKKFITKLGKELEYKTGYKIEF